MSMMSIQVGTAQPRTISVAKATEKKEEKRRAVENIIQKEVKDSEFKRASVAFRQRQKKWVAVRVLKTSIRTYIFVSIPTVKKCKLNRKLSRK